MVKFTKKIKCEICDLAFEKTELKDHFVVHENPVPFHCIYCENTFKERSELDSHLKEHKEKVLFDNTMGTNDCYTFKCHLCQLPFISNLLLKQHLRNHKEQKFSCVSCRRCFMNEAQLAVHRTKYHGDGRNYNCHLCISTFICSEYFYTHLRQKHGLVHPKLMNKYRFKYGQYKVLPKEFVIADDNDTEVGSSSAEESEHSRDESPEESDFDESNLTDASETSESEDGAEFQAEENINISMINPHIRLTTATKEKTENLSHTAYERELILPIIQISNDPTIKETKPASLKETDNCRQEQGTNNQDTLIQRKEGHIIISEVCESLVNGSKKERHIESEGVNKNKVPILNKIDTFIPQKPSARIENNESMVEHDKVIKIESCDISQEESLQKRIKLSTSPNKQSNATRKTNVFSIFETRKRKITGKNGKQNTINDDILNFSEKSETYIPIKQEHTDTKELKEGIAYTPLPLVAAIYHGSRLNKNEMMIVYTQDITVDLLLAVQQNSSNCILCVQKSDNLLESEDVPKLMKKYNANKINFTLLRANGNCEQWSLILFGQQLPPNVLKNKLFRSHTEIETVLEDYCSSLGFTFRNMLRHSTEDFSASLIAQLQNKITCCNFSKK